MRLRWNLIDESRKPQPSTYNFRRLPHAIKTEHYVRAITLGWNLRGLCASERFLCYNIGTPSPPFGEDELLDP